VLHYHNSSVFTDAWILQSVFREFAAADNCTSELVTVPERNKLSQRKINSLFKKIRLPHSLDLKNSSTAWGQDVTTYRTTSFLSETFWVSMLPLSLCTQWRWVLVIHLKCVFLELVIMQSFTDLVMHAHTHLINTPPLLCVGRNFQKWFVQSFTYLVMHKYSHTFTPPQFQPSVNRLKLCLNCVPLRKGFGWICWLSLTRNTTFWNRLKVVSIACLWKRIWYEFVGEASRSTAVPSLLPLFSQKFDK
jgi:hypothetical protein